MKKVAVNSRLEDAGFTKLSQTALLRSPRPNTMNIRNRTDQGRTGSSSVTVRSGRANACLLVALGLSLLAPSAPFLGQASGPTSRESHAPRRHTGPKIDDQVRVLAKNLNLSEAQQAAVKKILEQRQQQTQHIRLDPSLSGSARIDQFRALQDITVERIRAVLTEEQKKGYDPLLARKRQQPPQRSVEDWLRVTTPH